VLALSLFSISATFAETSTLPALTSSPLPKNLTPTLDGAKTDRPKPYADRCHVQQNLVSTNSPCIYGVATSKKVIVLFGDSHALSWFPAVEKYAIAKKMKLVSLTMSSCWPAEIPAYNSTTNQLMQNCPIWRDATIRQIYNLQPNLVIVAGTRGFSTINSTGQVATGDERKNIWEDGILTTFADLNFSADRVVYIADIPASIYDVPTCLASNQKDITKCATPFNKAVDLDWLGTEKSVAEQGGVGFIDPTSWICKTDPCSPISGSNEIYVDGGHMTATFAATLEPQLASALAKVV
jgi:hypothetical protein